jgi:hypothetical protein
VVPSQLIELGQQALTDVRIGVANGEPLVRCQLLASEFYEALKRALRAPELSPVERWAVMAAANMPSCRRCKHQPGYGGARAQSRSCNAAVQWDHITSNKGTSGPAGD